MKNNILPNWNLDVLHVGSSNERKPYLKNSDLHKQLGLPDSNVGGALSKMSEMRLP